MKAIISADWHIRATMPRCRKDKDWIETQRNALGQIVKISKEKSAPVIVVGDIFHSNIDTSFECIQMVQQTADKLGELYILAGNHDLPYHNSENIEKSAIGVLLNSHNIFPIKQYFEKLYYENNDDTYNYSAVNFDEEDNKSAEIIFKHTLTLPEKNPIIDCETPESLKKKFPNAKWIFTGDYHKSFTATSKDCTVVNPGCLLRQASDFKNYQCGVFYVDTEKDIVEFIPIIDEEELVDDSNILIQNERQERIDDFVSKLRHSKISTLDFVENVKKVVKENKLSEELKDIIYELMEV